MNLFDFGLVYDEPNVYDVIPDVEFEESGFEGSLIWIYGLCDISTEYPWCITPEGLVFL